MQLKNSKTFNTVRIQSILRKKQHLWISIDAVSGCPWQTVRRRSRRNSVSLRRAFSISNAAPIASLSTRAALGVFVRCEAHEKSEPPFWMLRFFVICERKGYTRYYYYCLYNIKLHRKNQRYSYKNIGGKFLYPRYFTLPVPLS